MNILHANIDVHIIIFIAGLPGYGMQCIAKLQSHCDKMTFSDKSKYDRNFQQFPHKGGEYAMNYIKTF